MRETNLAIEDQLTQEGYYVSTTVGMSMYPMLRDRRDRIVVTVVGEKKLKKYDLPLYKCPDGRYILHRIIGVKKDLYIIRGDNTYAKEYVPKEWILGYVSEFYREDRHILTSSKPYRLYAALWNAIYPLRWGYMKVRGLLGAIVRRLKKQKKSKL